MRLMPPGYAITPATLRLAMILMLMMPTLSLMPLLPPFVPISLRRHYYTLRWLLHASAAPSFMP
jgi:hypothetical protein